jgi:hypothetical protein
VRLRVVLVDAAGQLSEFDDLNEAPPMYPKALPTEPWLADAVETQLLEVRVNERIRRAKYCTIMIEPGARKAAVFMGEMDEENETRYDEKI